MNKYSRRTSLIAVVDDESAVRSGLGNLLKSAGYEAVLFEGRDALLAFDCFLKIDCLILDVKLANDDGFNLYRELQKLKFDVPVIFISGQLDTTAEQRAMRRGAISLLSKPVDNEVMLACIKQALLKPKQ